MPKIKVGDIIVARNKNYALVKAPSGRDIQIFPWIYGKVIYVHPEHGHLTYDNGAFNQNEWVDNVYLLDDWNNSAHSPLVPVINRGIV